GCRERHSGAAESDAQRSERFCADRQAGQAARYAEQDRRQGRLRHRRAVARDEICDLGAVPGVRQIVVLDDLVAVVGDHTWAAKKGLDALVITWNEGANVKVSSADIWDDLRAASK